MTNVWIKAYQVVGETLVYVGKKRVKQFTQPGLAVLYAKGASYKFYEVSSALEELRSKLIARMYRGHVLYEICVPSLYMRSMYAVTI